MVLRTGQCNTPNRFTGFDIICTRTLFFIDDQYAIFGEYECDDGLRT
jgi:hypothetical protein